MQRSFDHSNVATKCLVTVTDSWSFPGFKMSDGEATSLEDFTVSCDLFAMLVPGSEDLDTDMEFVRYGFDDCSLESLIMSTGFVLD